MKMKLNLVAIVIVLAASSIAVADRNLSRGEILQIFEQLTSQPRKTWIPAGTIEAAHMEYRAPKVALSESQANDAIAAELQRYPNDPDKPEVAASLQQLKMEAIPFNVRYELSNESSMTSAVIVRYDGDRFYWEITATSRTDSVKRGPELADNFMTDDFRMEWNARRIFAWDGEKYTTYSASAKHATIDSAGRTPHGVNGPLTAGIIAWGHGYYSYDSLCAAESSAVETVISGQTRIELTVNYANGRQMVFVLDPARDYAATCLTAGGMGDRLMTTNYSNFKLVAGAYVPTNILMETYDLPQDRLIARDLWEITKLDAAVPSAESFDVECTDDTTIELVFNATEAPAICRYSDIAEGRMLPVANKSSQPQNCATAALRHCLSKLGVPADDQRLSKLVSGADNRTSLAQMKQYVQSLGLDCKAVTTDISALRKLQDCQAIVHIPGRNHFVVLDGFEGRYARIADPLSNKYSRLDVDLFNSQWAEGTALLVSNRKISGFAAEIDGARLANIVGAAYNCNVVLQTWYYVPCVYIGGLCGGMYRDYSYRLGCGYAATGSCSMSILLRYKKAPCYEQSPAKCQNTSDWTLYYMRACG